MLIKEKKTSENDFANKGGEVIEEGDINNFNVSFFLPKDVNFEKDIDFNNNYFEHDKSNNVNLKDNNNDNFSNINQEKNYDIINNENNRLNFNFNNNQGPRANSLNPSSLSSNVNDDANFYIPNADQRPINYFFNNNIFNINYSPNIINFLFSPLGVSSQKFFTDKSKLKW